MTGMPSCLACRFRAAICRAIGRAWRRSWSPARNSRSLITSMSSRATADLSGALPCRSSFLAGMTICLPGYGSFWRCAASSGTAMNASPGGTLSGRHDVLLHGELHQLGAGLDTQFFHHAVLVEGNGPRRDFQDAGDLFHGVPLGEQLQHLALSLAQFGRF